MSDLILVLDDEISYATMVSDLLFEHGYQTDVCTQPREALERLHQKSYGLIISDYKMPEIDGAELLCEVRKILPNVPVIMISGLMGKPDLLKVANIGVTLVLEKPFNVPVFLDYVARFVSPSQGVAGGGLATPGTGMEAVDEDAPEFPRPVEHLEADSELMRGFLRGLWQRLDSHPHVLLVVPPGGEFEAISRQCSAWLGHDAAEACRLTTPELDRPEIREALRAKAEHGQCSPVVAVSVPDWVEVDLGALQRFVAWTREEPVVAERLHFLHALPDVIEARQFNPPAELTGVLSETLALPALRDRLVDLGGWVERIVNEQEESRRRPFSTAAVELLLQHDWPENHRELAGTVRRALAIARRGEVTEAAVRLALRNRHFEPPAETAELGLSGFLHGEQRRFLQQNLPKNNWFEALTRLVGGRFELLRADKGVDEQPLLFEELARVDAAR